MDARRIFTEVLREAGRLGLSHWERILLIIAAALLIVMGRRAWDVLRKVDPEPQVIADENGPQPAGASLSPAPNGPVTADENGPQPPGFTLPSAPENDGYGSYGG